MERVREEAAYLCSEYTEWRQRLADAPRDLPTTLCIDVDGPVAAAASPLEALAHTVPVLPLQFSILSNSLTNLPCRAPTAPELWGSEALSGTGCIRRVGLDAWTLRGGCLGIVWETTITEPPADGAEARRRAAVHAYGDGVDTDLIAKHVRGVPLWCGGGGGGDDEGTRRHAVSSAAFAERGGWPPGHPRCSHATGPSSTHRALPMLQAASQVAAHAHAAWVPRAAERRLCPMPAAQASAFYAGRGGVTRRSVGARDQEVLEGEADCAALFEELELQALLKCSCDGGGDCCRYIGLPPRDMRLPTLRSTTSNLARRPSTDSRDLDQQARIQAGLDALDAM